MNPNAIYVAGFSNGAMMAHGVASRLAGRIAAVAAVAGPRDPAAGTPSTPVSVIAFHGDADERVRYESDDFPAAWGGRTYPGVQDTVAFWVAHDGCASLPPQQSGSVRTERYTGGIDGAEVALYTILGGNHSWPGGTRVSLLGEPPTQAVSATDLIWDFFHQHPKP